MKIGGVEVTKCEEVLVLPRLNGRDLVFKATSVPSMQMFEDLCPRPKPAMKLTKGGKREPHLTDSYTKELEEWSKRRYAFICIKSLEPSEIEWETVNIDKPSTWTKWMEELRDAGLSDTEINRVQTLVLDANALNEEKLKRARESFLLGQGWEAVESSGLPTQQQSTQSGTPASE